MIDIARSSQPLSRWVAFPVIGLSALLLYCAQPGAGGSPLLAWIALPLLLAVLRGRRGAVAFGWGFVWGLVYFLLLLPWLRPFGSIAWITLSVIQAFAPAFFALIAAPLASRSDGWSITGIAAWWSLTEQLRTSYSFGFTWGDLSLSQTGFAPALYTASWWGAVGLSFVVALGSAAAFQLAISFFDSGRFRIPKEGKACAPALLFGLTLGILLCGAVGRQAVRRALSDRRGGGVARFGLVQGNHERALFTGEYRDPERALLSYEELTAGLARSGCRWILWPESALPEEIIDCHRRVSNLARRHRIHLLVGGSDDAPSGSGYNSIFHYGPDGRRAAVYHKRRLVPIGEFVPWRRYLPSLDRFGVPTSDVERGEGDGILRAGRLRIGAAICFESLMPGLALAQARAGVDLIAVATNDSYYGRTPAPEAHAAFLLLRSVETGLPGVQAASTGISFMALPSGEGVGRTRLFEKAAVAVDVPPCRPRTPWVRFPWLPWAVLVFVAPYASLRRLPSGRPPVTPSPDGEGRRRKTARPSVR